MPIADPPNKPPWFPNGDPLLPENRGKDVKVLHRLLNDYHQTYDVICWYFEKNDSSLDASTLSLEDYFPSTQVFASPLSEVQTEFNSKYNRFIMYERFTASFEAGNYVDFIYDIIEQYKDTRLGSIDVSDTSPFEYQEISRVPSLFDFEISESATISFFQQDSDGSKILRQITFNKRFLWIPRNVLPYSVEVTGNSKGEVTSVLTDNFMLFSEIDFPAPIFDPNLTSENILGKITIKSVREQTFEPNIEQVDPEEEVVVDRTQCCADTIYIGTLAEFDEKAKELDCITRGDKVTDEGTSYVEFFTITEEELRDSQPIPVEDLGGGWNNVAMWGGSTTVTGFEAEKLGLSTVTSDETTITETSLPVYKFLRLSRANFRETNKADKGDNINVFIDEGNDLELSEVYFLSDGNRQPSTTISDIPREKIRDDFTTETTEVTLKGRERPFLDGYDASRCSIALGVGTPEQIFRTESERIASTNTEEWEIKENEVEDKVAVVSLNDLIELIDKFYFEYEIDEETGLPELLRDTMPDSLRVKEIHQALEAQRYATYTSTLDGEEKPRVANIGYYIERIARILGINVLADGTAYTPRLINKVEIPDDGGIRDIELPEDSPHLNNQWGFGKESITSLRFDDDFMDFGVDDTDAPLSDLGYEAMVYPIATNKFVEDEATGELSQIKAGGVALVHNLPQLYDVIMQDVDKGLGLQEAGAYAIRSPEDSITGEVNLCTYEGLHSLVAENAYMISEVSRRASKAQVNSQLARMMLMSLMNITGLPIEPASFQTTINKDEEPQKIYYPRFAKSSPRLFELWVILMDNIGTLLGEAYNLPPEVQEKIQNLSQQEFDDLVNSIKEESEQWRR